MKYFVGKGWWPLLDESMPKLEKLGAEFAQSPYQKYGTLRVEAYPPDNATDSEVKEIDEIENKSAVTCEKCGGAGTERVKPNGWVVTLCKSCYDEAVTLGVGYSVWLTS